MDIVEHDGRAIWLGATPDPELPTFRILTSDDLISPLVEILPMQILTLVLAKRNNVTAGQFRIIGKVTTVE